MAKLVSEPSAVVMMPVGVVHSPYLNLNDMPIQNIAAETDEAELEVFEAFELALKDIQGFEYLMLITHLHQCKRQPLEVIPFLDSQMHGAFATRSPMRPNNLGLSIIKLNKVLGRRLHFSGNDMLNLTPVLDIKPYVPVFDKRDTNKVGWYQGRLDHLAKTRSHGM